MQTLQPAQPAANAFTSAPAKTSAEKPTTHIPYKLELSSIIYLDHTFYKTPSLPGGWSPIILSLDPESDGTSFGAFRCCGARTMRGFNTVDLTEIEKQDFVVEFLSNRTEYLSWYFILADYQLGLRKDRSQFQERYNIVDLFKELGAELLDHRPNKYHGPSDMYLYVWTPLKCQEQISKFATRVEGSGRRAGFDSIIYRWEPKWWTDLSPQDQQEYLNKQDTKIQTYPKIVDYIRNTNQNARNDLILNQAIGILSSSRGRVRSERMQKYFEQFKAIV